MCQINCSGGCPECAPEDHKPSCIDQYDSTGSCICDELNFLYEGDDSNSPENFLDYYSLKELDDS